MTCFFVSDLHGSAHRYDALCTAIAAERPSDVFLGGDLLPFDLISRFGALRNALRDHYPRVYLILGNDDPRVCESDLAAPNLWSYVSSRRSGRVYGYSYVPPTPFLLKDWERYDVSHYVDPGCVSPEEGHRTVAVPANEARYGTIASDLEALAGGDDVSDAVFLFHTPPYRTALDRAALDGHSFDHAPLDVHVGSIAVRQFIESRQPLLTLHGHVHESPRLTGKWLDRIGRTVMLSAAHDGPELALVRFELSDPSAATRDLV